MGQWRLVSELKGNKYKALPACMMGYFKLLSSSQLPYEGRSYQHCAELILFPLPTASCVFLLFVGQLSHTSCVLNHMEHVFAWTFMIEDICLSPMFAFRGSLHHLMVQLTACFASCSWLYIVLGDFTVFIQKKENKTKQRSSEVLIHSHFPLFIAFLLLPFFIFFC